jgi:hypothetical protein
MPTRYSLIAYFPHSLKIPSNCSLIHTWLIVLLRPKPRKLLNSGQSMKPQSADRGGFAEFELSYQNWNTMFKPPQLKSDWLWRLAKASTNFGKPSQRFPRVLEIPQSHWSHPQESPSILSVPFAVPEYLPLYRINTRLFLSQIWSLYQLILSRSENKSKT